jgi:hypothetical protein
MRLQGTLGMQDPVFELPRRLLPRTPMNRGKRKGRGCKSPGSRDLGNSYQLPPFDPRDGSLTGVSYALFTSHFSWAYRRQTFRAWYLAPSFV